MRLLKPIFDKRQILTVQIRRGLLAIATLAFAIATEPNSPTAHAEEAAQHQTVDLKQKSLGPYRPEHKPDLTTVEKLIVEQTNAFRHEHERASLSVNEALALTAEDFAAFMARTDLYGHNADKKTPFQRIEAHQYEYCIAAENIAYAFQTTGFGTKVLADEAVTGWINSPPHRENMLRESVTEIGVGVAQSDATGVFYAVQVFARPKSAALTFSVRNLSESDATYSVGKETYDVPVNAIRTHKICAAAEIQLNGSTKSFKPADGDQFEIVATDGSIQMKRGEKGNP